MNTMHPQPVPDLTDVTVEDEVVTSSPARQALAALRIAFGLTFLWAFFDKLLALGYHTATTRTGNLDRFGDAAWINGGSPTEGFLTFGVTPTRPFDELLQQPRRLRLVDWLFMLGLLGIGLALTLGVGIRLAAIAGVALYLFMYAAVMLPGEQPGHRRPPHRRHHHGRPGPHPGRRHLGPRQGLGQDPPGAPVRHPPLTLHQRHGDDRHPSSRSSPARRRGHVPSGWERDGSPSRRRCRAPLPRGAAPARARRHLRCEPEPTRPQRSAHPCLGSW